MSIHSETSLDRSSPLLPYQTLRDCITLLSTHSRSLNSLLPPNELDRLLIQLYYLVHLLFPQRFNSDDFQAWQYLKQRLSHQSQLVLLRSDDRELELHVTASQDPN